MKINLLLLIIAFSSLLFTNCQSLIPFKSEMTKYNIVNKSQGDLNNDGISDITIIVTNDKVEKDSVIIFLLNEKGKITKKFVNTYLTDSFIEWFGELPETTIENGHLSIWHYGDMCHRQSRTISFEFDKKLNNFFFKELVVAEHNVCNNQAPYSETTTSLELQKVRFSDYKDDL